MRTIVVGVGDCKLSIENDCELVSYALGSCIGVAIWDPKTHVAGLLHLMLPDSRAHPPADMQTQPYRYADTGLPLLFRRAYELGADKRRLIVRLAGGASMVDGNGVFNIGRRNHAAVRRILWQAGVLIHGEEVGGSISRTVRLDVNTGRFVIRDPMDEERQLPATFAGGGLS